MEVLIVHADETPIEVYPPNKARHGYIKIGDEVIRITKSSISALEAVIKYAKEVVK